MKATLLLPLQTGWACVKAFVSRDLLSACRPKKQRPKCIRVRPHRTTTFFEMP